MESLRRSGGLVTLVLAGLLTISPLGCNQKVEESTTTTTQQDEAPAPKVRKIEHITVEGDHLWKLAHKLYPQNPKAYWVALNDINYRDLMHLPGNECGTAENVPVNYPLKLPGQYSVY